MKKLTSLLTALILLLLLCACTDRAEAPGKTTESTTESVQTAKPDDAQAKPDTGMAAPDTTQTESDTGTAESDISFTPIEGGNPHALIDNTIGTIILEPTEPTIGLPTPVEPTYEIEGAELPPDDFD
ncbi:MAG: hypothetical protein ACI4V3_11025 [Faecousia sp.]